MPQRPVSGRALPFVAVAVVAVALAGVVGAPEVLDDWLSPTGGAPWEPADPVTPSFAGGPPPGFVVVPAAGTELARFEKGASSVALVLEPHVARSGSAQWACSASLREWARVLGIAGDVKRTTAGKIGPRVASGVRLDADGRHAVQRCVWVDVGGLLSVRGTSSSPGAEEVDAAVEAVASAVTPG